MLKKVKIKNVQGHEETELTLHPGFNVIMGTSDSGKSSLIRAIRWGLENRPRGDVLRSDFLTDDTVPSEVELRFEEGWIARRKNKGALNEYKVGTKDVGEMVLKALRADLPEEVTHISRMSSLNLQSQHDPYFLLQDTPGNVAKRLNEVVGLEVIDEVIAKINRLVNRLVVEAEVKRKEEKALKEDLQKYHSLPRIESLISEIEGLMREEAKYVGKVAAAEGVLDQIENFVRVEAQLREWLKVKGEVQGLDEKEKEVRHLISKQTKIIEICQSIDDAQRTREKTAHALTVLKKQYDDMLKRLKICPMCGQRIPQP